MYKAFQNHFDKACLKKRLKIVWKSNLNSILTKRFEGVLRDVRHTVPYCRTPCAVRRTAVRRVPYAVRRTTCAVQVACRTPCAVRRTPYCRTAVLPYAVLPYSHTAVRRTAVRRTLCAVLLYGQWESSEGYGHQVLRLSVEKSTLMALLTIRKSSDSEKAILILLHMTPACEKPQVLRSQAS